MDGTVKIDSPDWSALLLELRTHGWDNAKVARIIGVTPSAVNMWQNKGVEPRYCYGKALQKLHTQVVHRRAISVWFDYRSSPQKS